MKSLEEASLLKGVGKLKHSDSLRLQGDAVLVKREVNLRLEQVVILSLPDDLLGSHLLKVLIPSQRELLYFNFGSQTLPIDRVGLVPQGNGKSLQVDLFGLGILVEGIGQVLEADVELVLPSWDKGVPDSILDAGGNDLLRNIRVIKLRFAEFGILSEEQLEWILYLLVNDSLDSILLLEVVDLDVVSGSDSDIVAIAVLFHQSIVLALVVVSW